MRPRRTCNSLLTPKQVAVGIHGREHSRQRCVNWSLMPEPPSGAWIASVAASIMFLVSKDGQHGPRSSNDFCSFGYQAVVQLMAMERARSDHKEISIYALSEMSHR